MSHDSGATTSVWSATVEIPRYEPLTRDLDADVCIIGAGMAGVSVGYHLARAGKRVIILDDGPPGGGESGRTTAHLANAWDDRYYHVEKELGQKAAQLIADSHTAAINWIERIVKLEDIDCGFERLDGYLFAGSPDREQSLEEELQAARRAGLVDVQMLDHAPAPFHTGRVLRYPNQGQFHPLRYLEGLLRAIARDGGQVFSGSHVNGIEAPKDGQPGKVTVESGKSVTCRDIVVCTNSPVNDWVTMHTKQAPYRTYVVGLRVPKDSVPRVLLWDDLDPYHYVRVAGAAVEEADHDILIVGGEDRKTGQYENDDQGERFRALEEWTRDRFPMAMDVVYRWSGQVMEPTDSVAFIGRNPNEQHVYICTGDSGMGMTHTTIAGVLISDLVLGRENPWTELYDPSRVTLSLGSVMDFAKENLNVAKQYADWLLPGDTSSIDHIVPGSGAVIRRGTHKIAVYRADDGSVMECSAVCTHLGCIVRWNETEKSWDCPCHGSRFAPDGNVLNGPAVKALSKLEENSAQPKQGESQPQA